MDHFSCSVEDVEDDDDDDDDEFDDDDDDDDETCEDQTSKQIDTQGHFPKNPGSDQMMKFHEHKWSLINPSGKEILHHLGCKILLVMG